MRTLHALGLLLSYPTNELVEAMPELRNVLLAEEFVGAETLTTLEPLFKTVRDGPLLDLQEDYVSLFDRQPGLSLHLFEHVYGESRDRGQALAELSDLYASSDMLVANGETPDYLPAFVEFLGAQPEKEARRLLGEVGHILLLLSQRLEQRQSPYGAVMRALTGLCEPHPEDARVEEASRINPDEAPDLEKSWEEPEAFPSRACGSTLATSDNTRKAKMRG